MSKSRVAIPHNTKIDVLTEAGYRCAVPTCRTILAIDMHHIDRVSEEGGNEMSNLIALCPNCHRLYHKKINRTVSQKQLPVSRLKHNSSMPTPANNRFQKLVDNIARLYTNARKAQVRFAWETGRQIVLEEQEGDQRAEYGSQLIPGLSQALTKKFGPGFSINVLRKMRQFYVVNPKQPPSVELDWSDHVELLPLKDQKLRRTIEQKILENGLKAKEIRRLVRRSREDAGEEIREISPVPLSGPQELLTPKRGTPYTYRLVKRPELGAGKDDALLLDLGFGIFKRLSARIQSRFTENQIIESQWDDTQEIYSFKTSERTAKDLFTYQAVVERVIDGDTLKVRVDLGFDLEHRETLRLRGIDAPEMSSKAGESAKAFVQSIIKEADTITIFTSRSDKYDRYLADIFARSDSGEVFVNNLFLERGHAGRMKE